MLIVCDINTILLIFIIISIIVSITHVETIYNDIVIIVSYSLCNLFFLASNSSLSSIMSIVLSEVALWCNENCNRPLPKCEYISCTLTASRNAWIPSSPILLTEMKDHNFSNTVPWITLILHARERYTNVVLPGINSLSCSFSTHTSSRGLIVSTGSGLGDSAGGSAPFLIALLSFPLIFLLSAPN